MGRKDNLVSAVLTTYERPNLLIRSLESVIKQSYKNIEIIVVDDNSTKNVREVVDQFDDHRIRFIKHKQNQGLSAARNTGIEASSGKYIAFLDDDDEWLPTKLEKQLHVMRESELSPALVYCWMRYISEERGELHERKPEYRGDIFEHSLDSQPIGNGSTFLVNREVCEELGGFDESLPRGIDGDFVRRLSLDHDVDYVDEVLVNYYVEHGSQRITRSDEVGIRNRIIGKMAKLDKFHSELENYPDKHAVLYAQLGYQYSRVAFFKKALNAYWHALKIRPLSSQVHKLILSGLKQSIFGLHS